MLKKDSLITGVIIGILLPIVLYGIIYFSFEASGSPVTRTVFEKLQLFLIAVNAFVMRQFMVNREQDNIGRGILLVTMIAVLAHFAYYYTELFE